MRLRQLDLIRYGKFADTTLDFGPADRDCDVTVVYGHNEAGKSTAFAAWLDLLFGLPLQTPHAFRFDRKDMMVGAVIETVGETLTLRRTGARQDALTDDQGRAVADHRLNTLLHGLDRDAYRDRFSLDEAILRQGGEEIARARGDLGQLLHAGTSGLSGLSEALANLEGDVDAFHKKSGRKTRLAVAKQTLKDIDADLRAARLDPRRYDVLRADLDGAQDNLAAARETLHSAQHAVQLREAAQQRREMAADIAALQESLAQAADGPDLPPDAVPLVVAATERRSAAVQDLARQEDRLRTAQTDLAGLEPDPEGLALAALLAELDTATFDDGELLLPRVQTATADIARRRRDHAERTQSIQALADRILSGADPATLLLDRSVLDTLRTSATRVRDARRTVADLDAAFAENEAALGPEVPRPEGLAELGDALQACQRDGTDPQALTTAATTARLTADRAAVALPGDWRDLVRGDGLPQEATLRLAATELDRALARTDAAQHAVTDAGEALAASRAARDAALQRDATVTDGAIRQSRAARDAVWAEHLAKLDETSAGTFEDAMRRDDQLRDRHAATAEARLRLAALEEHCQTEQARVARRTVHLRTEQAATQSAQDRIAGLARQLGLAADSPPDALRDRRQTLIAALDAALLADAAEDAAEAGRARRAALLARLDTALRATAADPASPDELLAQAERQHERLVQQAQEAETRRKAAHGLGQLARRLDRAHAEATQAETAFATAQSGLWCDGRDAEEMLARLPDVEALTEEHRARAALAHRIAALDAALAAFADAADKMRALLDLDRDVSPTALLSAARARALDARKTADRIAQLEAICTDAKARMAEATRGRLECDAEIADVLQGQTLAPETAPAVAVRQLEARDRDRATLRKLQVDHSRAARGLDANALSAEDAISDPLRLTALREAVTAAETARDAAQYRAGQADEALRQAMAAGGGAELDQRRATLLETLREDARESFAQLLGLVVARDALRRFRQDNRGDMLTATERAFATLTHGEWQTLETRSLGKTEQLVALRNGEAVTADAMSTGTRGQLYLALRIAGHADFVARNGPLPFVTDDIHETFDDRRASAALDLAAQMGRLGQTILFTHHRHLVALAQERIAEVRVLDVT